MNITDILELDDGYPVASLDRCDIIKIGEKKPGSQLIVVTDGEAKLNIFLKDESHFIDTESDKKQIAIKSGKPVNGKPTGLTFRIVDGKKRLLVSKASTVVLGIDEDKPDEEEKTVQLTETVEESNEQIAGPMDKLINQRFSERLHILKILNKRNEEAGNPFSQRSIEELLIGCHMDSIIGNNGRILPDSSTKRKNRYDDDHPKETMPDLSKEAKADKPEQGGSEFVNITIAEAINANEEWFKGINDPEGNPIVDAFKDRVRRAKMFKWFYSQKSAPKGKLLAVYDLCKKFGSVKSIRALVLNEAVLYSISEHKKIPYIPKNEDKLEHEFAQLGVSPKDYFSTL